MLCLTSETAPYRRHPAPGSQKNQMENNLRGIDMVVGAKGSPLQLILSSVYHIDSPTGNIPLEEAEEIKLSISSASTWSTF